MHKDGIFSQASLPKRVWGVAVKVMDLFEDAYVMYKIITNTCLPRMHYLVEYWKLGKVKYIHVLLVRVITF